MGDEKVREANINSFLKEKWRDRRFKWTRRKTNLR